MAQLATALAGRVSRARAHSAVSVQPAAVRPATRTFVRLSLTPTLPSSLRPRPSALHSFIHRAAISWRFLLIKSSCSCETD